MALGLYFQIKKAQCGEAVCKENIQVVDYRQGYTFSGEKRGAILNFFNCM
jgi:hypothetical protein